MNAVKQLLVRLGSEKAVLVTVSHTKGSVPRNAGAWMAVFAKDALATIGGGKLELDAIAHARALLRGESVAMECAYALGPSLGQCCGGVVHLHYQPVCHTDVSVLQTRLMADHVPVALFGAGHVGLAVVHVLGTLPFQVSWIDSRDNVFPGVVPDNVQCDHSEPVHGAVDGLAPGSRVVIMSFSHAEDLDIVAACLKRQRQRADLPYVGLIGSKTKWASFRHRLLERGYTDAELAHITSPIGVPGIADKRPEAIAISVAAQILQVAQ